MEAPMIYAMPIAFAPRLYLLHFFLLDLLLSLLKGINKVADKIIEQKLPLQTISSLCIELRSVILIIEMSYKLNFDS